MVFESFVIFEVPEVDLAEDLLESDVLVGVLLDDVGVGLLQVVSHVPHVQRGAVAKDQPHLIY